MAQTRFNFVGTVTLPKAGGKRPFVRKMNGKNGNLLIINFGVKADDHNMSFVEAFAGEQKSILTMNTDNEKIEVPWDERFSEEVVKSVANYKKTVVDLGEELGGRKEFLSMYDAILYMEENLPKYEGKICVTGQMRKDAYQGRYLDKYIIQSVYAVPEDRKGRLGLTIDYYYNKDSVDKADWKSEKKIYLNGYIQQYINKDEGSKFIEQQLIFDANKYKEDNEKHQALLKYKLKYVDIKEKQMHHMMWECVLLNGAQVIEFSEDQLTEAQKEQLALGIRELKDFMPSGSIYGDRISEVRVFEPILKGDFAEGLVNAELTADEFEEMIYVPAKEEKLDEVIDKSKEEKVELPFEEEVEEDDLF